MTPILTLNICIYTYSMLYYKHIVIEMYGILLVVFVDTFSLQPGSVRVLTKYCPIQSIFLSIE